MQLSRSQAPHMSNLSTVSLHALNDSVFVVTAQSTLQYLHLKSSAASSKIQYQVLPPS